MASPENKPVGGGTFERDMIGALFELTLHVNNLACVVRDLTLNVSVDSSILQDAQRTVDQVQELGDRFLDHDAMAKLPSYETEKPDAT